MKPFWEVFGEGIKKQMDPRKRYLYVVAESANDLPLGKIIKRKMHENGKRQYYLVERKGEK